MRHYVASSSIDSKQLLPALLASVLSSAHDEQTPLNSQIPVAAETMKAPVADPDIVEASSPSSVEKTPEAVNLAIAEISETETQQPVTSEEVSAASPADENTVVKEYNFSNSLKLTWDSSGKREAIENGQPRDWTLADTLLIENASNSHQKALTTMDNHFNRLRAWNPFGFRDSLYPFGPYGRFNHYGRMWAPWHPFHHVDSFFDFSF
eukprot:Gregarina_sp_Poly_1__1069@NODE_1261_length_4583_cov_29_317095_g856_i0_p4_GENE_NODE_1261_length_4583_cov_29_317095_g856_i0NODE_1261_length_4583_cov_29_317095_g856_i0_p4_ORF_typecomplete_len208_score37_78_NODE_1261_length_4583_cov_29_317095_g856_i038724495